MSQGRDAARVTPYELAVPGRRFVEERFPEVEEEAGARGGDGTDPTAFVNLGAVGRILQEIRGDDDDPELIQQHGYLVFHAYHFWRAGEPLYVVEPAAARFLVESEPEVTADAPPPPASAGYLQLPRNLFWSWPDPEDESAPAEPVDGVFWTAAGDGTLWTLAALGLRADRPGLSIFPLPPVPLADAGAWLGAKIREEGEDFRSTLPGGELDELYSVETAGEVLKLLGRAFWYAKSFPEAVEGPLDPPAAEGASEGGESPTPGGAAPDEGLGPPEGAASGPGTPSPEGPTSPGSGAASPAGRVVPSRLRYRRIGLKRGGGGSGG